VTGPASPDQPDYAVLTPERVSLEYDVAGIGSRSAALLVDSTIQWLVYLVVLVAGIAGLSALDSNTEDLVFGLTFALFALVSFAIFVAYFAVFEILWGGQTPGKRLMRIRVIRENGYPLRAGDAVIRNLIRVIDFLPGLYLFGLLSMLFNSRAKRLGDFAAGTIVVRESGGTRLTPSQVAAAATPDRAIRVGGNEMALARDFLWRRDSLTREARADLAARIAKVVAASSQRQVLLDELGAEAFLEEVAGSESES
jgi:uncharacterized RDD family membrane protein YckC